MPDNEAATCRTPAGGNTCRNTRRNSCVQALCTVKDPLVSSGQHKKSWTRPALKALSGQKKKLVARLRTTVVEDCARSHTAKPNPSSQL